MKHAPDTDAAIRIRTRRARPRHAAPPAEADRRVVAAIIALVVTAVAAVVVLWPASHQRGPKAAPADVAEPAWHERLAALYEVRAQAFDTGDADLLAGVYTPGSRQLRADLETIESLGAQGRRVVGFAPKLLEIESVSLSGDTAVVVVRDKIEAFSIVDATGTEMPVAGRAPVRITLTLHEVAGAWLIEAATRAPDPGPGPKPAASSSPSATG